MTYFKKLLLKKLIAFVILSIAIVSCKKEITKTSSDEKLTSANEVGLPPPIIGWGRGPNVPIVDQSGAPVSVSFPFGFAINGKGYIGGGFSANQPHRTLQYDTATRSWTQVADFPGNNDITAAAFVIGNYAYVCTGGVAGSNQNWQYNPLTNVWTRKADFPGTSRFGAVGVAMNGKGYIGLGINLDVPSGMKDWWEYNPVTDTWTRKTDFPGIKRDHAVAFAIDDKGYVATGHHYNQNTAADIYYNDLWQYNPATDSWTQKADMPGIARYYAVGVTAFTNKGIVAAGGQGYGPFLNDCWEYIPSTNSWFQLPNVGGGSRAGGTGFAIGNTLYLGCGAGYSPTGINDFWGLTINP